MEFKFKVKNVKLLISEETVYLELVSTHHDDGNISLDILTPWEFGYFHPGEIYNVIFEKAKLN